MPWYVHVREFISGQCMVEELALDLGQSSLLATNS